MIKVYCIAGYVYAKDGDKHYISPNRLVDLFRIPRGRMDIKIFHVMGSDLIHKAINHKTDIVIRPLDSGNYTEMSMLINTRITSMLEDQTNAQKTK